MKVLITTGCSFSEPELWPYHLEKRIPNLSYKNYGKSGMGNEYISRTVFHSVTELLKSGMESKEILVMCCWTAFDRLQNSLNAEIEKFNSQLSFQRDQFNTQNSQVVEQSNVLWRRQLNTANTAGQNAVNQANAMNSFNLSNQGLSFLWQEMRDAAKWEYKSAQNAEERQTNLSIAALGNEAATDATKSENISALAGFGLKVWEKFDSARNK